VGIRDAEFQVHAAADVLKFKHGASQLEPAMATWTGLGRTRDDRRAELRCRRGERRCSGDEELDFEDGGGWEIVEEDAAFDFGLNDGIVDVIGKVGCGMNITGETLLGVYSKF